MIAVVFTLQADAETYGGQVSTFAGYPKADRIVGQGRSALSTTLRHRAVVQHPVLPQWALVRDGVEQAAQIAPPLSASVQDIDPVAWGLAAVAQVG